ncbi:MAG: hypothetical protein KBB75_01430 [Candidatus Pacebacteria bacterium]|nr:hypothetical protein [Candidatus Paceibacterota bacterium]
MRIRNIFITAFLSLALFVVGGQHFVQAKTGDNLFGYAWSSNIGWISFNNCTTTSASSCTGNPYGVTMNENNGNLSGEAWSSNIGWISFNETSGCPVSGCTTQPKVNPGNGTFSGWARALSHGGGWDGWINLSGATMGANNGGIRPVSGFVWGADVVGWVDMSGVSYGGAPTTVTLTASSWNNGSSTLTWTSTGADRCSAVTPSGWTAKTTTSDTQVINNITSQTTYTIKCQMGENGTPVEKSATVTPSGATVTLSASNWSAGNSTLTWTSTGADRCSAVTPTDWTTKTTANDSQAVSGIDSTTTYTISCKYGANGTPAQASVTVSPATQSVTFSSYQLGATQYMLVWTSTGMDRCSAVTPAGWTSKTAVGGQELKTDITTQTTFTISCKYGANGTPIEKSVTIGGSGGEGTGPKKIKPVYIPK